MSSFQHIVIVGAGGHGREVAGIATDAAAHGHPPPLGFVDDDASRWGTAVDGLPVLGGWDWLSAQDPAAVGVAVAVGRPSVTEALADRVQAMGFQLASVVSPLAWVSPLATIGSGCLIFPHVSVHTRVLLGRGVTLNVGASVSHDSRIGDFSNVNPGARLAGSVSVGCRAYIGMMAAVIQGRSVGDDATVGAGGVVIRDVKPGCTVVGVPARPLPVEREDTP